MGGSRRITDMAFLRKRASGNYSLVFKWKGKSYIKALGTDDEQAANEIKQDGFGRNLRAQETAGPAHLHGKQFCAFEYLDTTR